MCPVNEYLVSVREQVERTLGTKSFVALYVCSGVAGNVLSCIVDPLTPVREGLHVAVTYTLVTQASFRCRSGGSVALYA